jgi:uncharacterized integral membrane protein (TIGR00697 family)
MIVSGAYLAAQMLADIASLRIIEIGGEAVDAGTLIYPFTFTLRDLVHMIAGTDAARILIFLAAGINVFMAVFFWLVARFPADAVTGPQLEFGDLLSPVWGIVVASILAEVISELIDTEAYQRWVGRFGDRYQWGRVLASMRWRYRSTRRSSSGWPLSSVCSRRRWPGPSSGSTSCSRV